MLKKILIGLSALVGLILVAGLILPKEFHIEREIIINKPKDFVFAELKMVKTHSQWSPWSKLDPNLKEEFRGEDGTVGFVASWSGNKEVGVGEQEITNIVDGEKIELALRFTEPMQDTSKTYFTTETVGENQTKVKWGMQGETPFPMNIFCTVMNMTGTVEKEFDKGLASLKTLLESK